MVVNKVSFYVFEIHTLNANLYCWIKYTFFPKIALNWYSKRSPRGPRRCVEKVPFPAFFLLVDDNMFN